MAGNWHHYEKGRFKEQGSDIEIEDGPQHRCVRNGKTSNSLFNGATRDLRGGHSEDNVYSQKF